MPGRLLGRLRVAQIFLLFCLVAIAAAEDPAARTSATSANGGHLIPPKVPLKGVKQFGEVTPHLYRGAHPSKTGFKNLARMGVDIVVDLRGKDEGERKEVTKLGMQYVAIPWHCYNKKDSVFAEFLTLIRQNPDKKVFVHCRLGDDRTGMMIAAYRMAEQSWTAEEAMKEMQKFGFVWWHHLICPGLAGYESSFPKKFQTSPAFESVRAGEKSASKQE